MSMIAEFMMLGGYASYIWPCYGLSFGFVLVLYIQTRRHTMRVQARIDALAATEKKAKK